MVESARTDDPFERAARKERLARQRTEPRMPPEDYTAAPGMLGFTATWAVVLWLHAWLSGTDGLFRIHLIAFVLWSAITAGVVVHTIAARLLRHS